MDDENKKVVLRINKGLIWRKLASWCLNSNGDDLVALIEVINFLRQDLGEEVLKEHYKDEYKNKILQLRKIDMILRRIKSYYDDLKRTRKIQEDTKSEKFRLFRKEMTQVPLFYDVVYEMYFFLIKETTLIDQAISHESFIQETQSTKSYSVDDDIKRGKDGED